VHVLAAPAPLSGGAGLAWEVNVVWCMVPKCATLPHCWLRQMLC
jgi:hypothetical protein